MADHRGENIQTLLGDALRDTTDLARKELALFKAEMAQNVRNLAMGLAMFVAAAVFAIICISLLTQSLVEWLATKVNSDALASLIVAVIMGAIAGGLILYGRSKMSASTLTPDRTIRNVQRDTAVLSERVSQFGAVLERAVGAVRRNPVPAMLAAAGLGWLFYRVAQDSRRPDLSWAGKMEEESVPVLVTGQDRVYDPDSSPRHPTQDLVETRRDMSARA
jgi:hypothetical protein